MYVDHSHVEHPKKNISVCVCDIFRLRADRTYFVNHERLDKKILVYTDMGQGKLLYQDDEFLLEANQVLVLSPKDAPFLYWTEGEKWHFWWFEFQGEIQQPPGIYEVEDPGFTEQLCSKIMMAHQRDSAAAASYLSCLLTFLSESVQKETDDMKTVFLQAQTLIKEHLYHINISSLAQQLCMNPRTLYNLFQRYAECSPKDYLKGCVIDRAKYLLGHTSKNIAEIAEEIGFANAFHFSRVFKAETGKAPSRYRKDSMGHMEHIV